MQALGTGQVPSAAAGSGVRAPTRPESAVGQTHEVRVPCQGLVLMPSVLSDLACKSVLNHLSPACVSSVLRCSHLDHVLVSSLGGTYCL